MTSSSSARNGSNMTAPKLPPVESSSPALKQENYPGDYAADFRRLYHALLERAWIVALCLIASLLLGAAYLRRAPVLYSSTATILVEQDQQRFFKIENIQFEDLQSLDYLQTIAQSLKTRPLLERVAESNRLAADPRFLVFTNAPRNREEIADELDDMINVKLRRGTRLIDVTATHHVPEYTAKIANSLVRQFISDNAERHVTSTEVANELLLKESERLRKKLQESERALQAYKENSKASSLDDRQNTVVAELKELSAKVTEAKSVRIRAESDYNQVMELGSNVDALLTLPAVANDPALIALRLNLSKAEDDFAALRQRYKEKHPKYIQAQSQISALLNDLTNTVLKTAQKMKTNLDVARAAEDALEKARKAQEISALELSQLAIQYTVLAREVESDRTLYDSVLNRMKETSVTKEMKPAMIRIIQPAYQPDAPFSPRKARIVVFSALAGMFAGFLIVLCINFLDTSIKTVDEAESLLHLPALCSISQIQEARKSPLIIMDEAKSAGAEAFRTLRAALSMLGRVEDRRVFLFTSAMPKEGKTFCSVNYAASLAQLGLKTILIDGDLRRPTVEATLRSKTEHSPGVTDYLTGQKTFHEVIQSTQLEKLFFIPGGTVAPNPAELLAKDGLQGLINEALKDYDRVVLDSAPIHAVSDTLLMLAGVQTVCLVVRGAWTSNRSVIRCVQLFQNAKAPLSGVIMNRMPVRWGLYGSYYYNPYYEYCYRGKYARKGVYGT